MKAILQSIRPQHCVNIAEGEKTIVVMKTKPNIPIPFKVYIYQNKTVCVSKYNEFLKPILHNCLGKIIGEYVCDYITTDFLISDTCISVEDLEKYSGNKAIYGWHISNLVIYDKPKELSEFYVPCYSGCEKCEYKSWDTAYGGEIKEMICTVCNKKPLTRPPRSWCYVEGIKNEHSKNKKELYVMGIALGYCL